MNMLIASLLALLGFSSCRSTSPEGKYGIPQIEKKYGPPIVEDMYGVPFPEEPVDVPEEPSVEVVVEPDKK